MIRWSMGGFSMCPRMSIFRSVRPSVGDAFFKNNKNQCFSTIETQGRPWKGQSISLDASPHLYKRVSLLVGRSVCQSLVKFNTMIRDDIAITVTVYIDLMDIRCTLYNRHKIWYNFCLWGLHVQRVVLQEDLVTSCVILCACFPRRKYEYHHSTFFRKPISNGLQIRLLQLYCSDFNFHVSCFWR